MNISFAIHKLFVHPSLDGLSNVIGKVIWFAQLEEDGAKSNAAGETLLDDVASAFTPYEQVTEQQIIEWVVSKQGGQAFIDMLSEIHAPMLAQKKREMLLEEAQLPFTATILDGMTREAQGATDSSVVVNSAVGVIPTVTL